MIDQPTTFDISDLLKTPADAIAYLRLVLEDGDETELSDAITHVLASRQTINRDRLCIDVETLAKALLSSIVLNSHT